MKLHFCLHFFTYIRAAAYTQINKYSEAIQDCHTSIRIDPNYSKAYSRLGLVYYAQGNYRDALVKGFRNGWERITFIPKIYSYNLFLLCFYWKFLDNIDFIVVIYCYMSR